MRFNAVLALAWGGAPGCGARRILDPQADEDRPAMTAAFFITLREGLEAALIVYVCKLAGHDAAG
jgi:hypothetical protein